MLFTPSTAQVVALILRRRSPTQGFSACDNHCFSHRISTLGYLSFVVALPQPSAATINHGILKWERRNRRRAICILISRIREEQNWNKLYAAAGWVLPIFCIGPTKLWHPHPLARMII